MGVDLSELLDESDDNQCGVAAPWIDADNQVVRCKLPVNHGGELHKNLGWSWTGEVGPNV